MAAHKRRTATSLNCYAPDLPGPCARDHGRMQKVARTIAGLAEAPDIAPAHLTKAIQCEKMLRSSGGEEAGLGSRAFGL